MSQFARKLEGVRSDDIHRGLSLRANFVFLVVGRGVAAASQWAILVVMANLVAVGVVGQYALAVSICLPITDFAGLGLASVITTDSRREFRFGDYFGLRIVLSALALLIICVFALVSGKDVTEVVIVVVLGVSMVAAMQSDMLCGLFQQRERMDYVSRSFVLRGLLSLALFTAGLAGTGELVVALIGVVAANVLVFVFHDGPMGARLLRSAAANPENTAGIAPNWNRDSMLRLARKALPLGVAAVFAALSTSSLNVTRYFVAGRQGLESLGHFAVIVSLILISDRLVQPLAVSATPRLARMLSERRIRDFTRLLSRLGAVALVIGGAQLVVVLLAGEWILGRVYATEYAMDAPELVLLAWASLMRNAATVIEYGVLATRRFRLSLLHQIMVLLAAVGASHLMVGPGGLRGAAESAAVLFFAQLVTVSCVLVWGVRAMRPRPNGME